MHGLEQMQLLADQNSSREQVDLCGMHRLVIDTATSMDYLQ